MKRVVLGALAIAALMTVATEANGQQRRGLRPIEKHDGFWLSLGAGGGWEDFDGSFGTQGRGGAFFLRMGGTPSQRFLFGGEVTGWFNGGAYDDLSRFNVMGTAMIYPFRAGGWFLKGGFGFAEHSAFGRERSGLGASAGTGVDIRLGRNFYLTPTVDYLGQFFDSSTVGVFLVTLGVTWH
jgi:opacity protein-like surface antigen